MRTFWKWRWCWCLPNKVNYFNVTELYTLKWSRYVRFYCYVYFRLYMFPVVFYHNKIYSTYLIILWIRKLFFLSPSLLPLSAVCPYLSSQLSFKSETFGTCVSPRMLDVGQRHHYFKSKRKKLATSQCSQGWQAHDKTFQQLHFTVEKALGCIYRLALGSCFCQMNQVVENVTYLSRHFRKALEGKKSITKTRSKKALLPYF